MRLRFYLAPFALAGLIACDAHEPSAVAIPQGCQTHIELQSASQWAKELGQSEEWVIANHRINVFERRGDDRGRMVGKLLPGSRAVILEKADDAYRISSPLDQSIGWVSKIQTVRTVRQDVATRKAC